MLGLRFTTRRELLLWQATIADLKQDVLRMRSERDHERERAEGAINALLARSAGVAVLPREKDIEDHIDRTMDIFNEADQDKEQAKLMEEMQG